MPAVVNDSGGSLWWFCPDCRAVGNSHPYRGPKRQPQRVAKVQAEKQRDRHNKEYHGV